VTSRLGRGILRLVVLVLTIVQTGAGLTALYWACGQHYTIPELEIVTGQIRSAQLVGYANLLSDDLQLELRLQDDPRRYRYPFRPHLAELAVQAIQNKGRVVLQVARLDGPFDRAHGIHISGVEPVSPRSVRDTECMAGLAQVVVGLLLLCFWRIWLNGLLEDLEPRSRRRVEKATTPVLIFLGTYLLAVCLGGLWLLWFVHAELLDHRLISGRVIKREMSMSEGPTGCDYDLHFWLEGYQSKFRYSSSGPEFVRSANRLLTASEVSFHAPARRLSGDRSVSIFSLKVEGRQIIGRERLVANQWRFLGVFGGLVLFCCWFAGTVFAELLRSRREDG